MTRREIVSVGPTYVSESGGWLVAPTQRGYMLMQEIRNRGGDMTARQLMAQLGRIVGNTIGNPAVWPDAPLTREQLHQIRYAVTELTWNEVFAIIEAQDIKALEKH